MSFFSTMPVNRLLITVLFSFTLAACGGGGSGSDETALAETDPVETTPVETTPVETTPEETTPEETIPVAEIAPVITLNGNNIIELVHDNAYSVYNELGATAFDQHGQELDVTISDNININALGSYSVIYTAVDSEGNESTAIRTVNVVEPTPFITVWKTDNYRQFPAFDSNDDQIRIGTFGEGYDFTIDWGDGTVESNQIEGKTHTYAQPGIYTIKITGQFPRLYFDTDRRGFDNDKLLSVEQWGNNIWQDMTQAFKDASYVVFNATDKPNLTQVTSMISMFEGATTFNSDITDWDVSNVTSMSSIFTKATNFNQNLTSWDFSQVQAFHARSSGLSRENYDALLNRLSEQSLQSGLDVTIDAYYTEAGEAARTFIEETYNWTFDDNGLRNSPSSDDREPDAIVNGESLITVAINGTYVELGVIFIDEVDGALDVVITGEVDTSTVGIYTLTYTATDISNNQYSRTRTVNVVDIDVSKPIIILKGDSEITLGQDESYIEQGASAVDARDGTLSVTITGTIDDKTTGTYTLTYTAEDAASNIASVTRTVIVPADISAPILTLNGDSVIKLTVNTSYTELGATANDWREGEITNITIDDSDVQIDVKGTYSVSYSAADSLNNTAVIYRTVEVLDPDTTNPIITLIGDSVMDWTQGYDYNDLGAAGIDDRDGELTVVVTDDVNTSITGTYTVTYTATDAANNSTTINRTINVVVPTPFITTWDMPADNLTLTIPTTGTGYDYTIDWGDGSAEETNQTGDATHTYPSEGVYTVTITGPFPRLYFRSADNEDELLTVEQWGNNIWSSMEYAFYRAENMTMMATDMPILHQVTSMANMFFSAESFNGDIGNWDVSNVTNMSSAFRSAESFNQDIGGWDVSNVTNMDSMFFSASVFNQDISGWDVSNVTNMDSMFYSAIVFNQDISTANGWDVSNVTNMASMFAYARLFEQDISDWDVANVTDMSVMFAGLSRFNADISAWDVSNVTNMSGMFIGANAFTQDISTANGWDVSNVTNMASMFSSNSTFNQDISDWDVSNVTDMQSMFARSNFNQDISGWVVSNVTTMESMFEKNDKFNQDISIWDVSSVTNLESMFEEASAFDQNLGDWAMLNVTSINRIFYLSGLSTANYDAALNGWASQVLQQGLFFIASGSVYSSFGEASRQYIIDTYVWTFSGDSLEP